MYTIQSGNTVFVADRVKLQPDLARVKQCTIRAPFLFKDRPVVTVTISTEEASTPMLLYGVEQFDATGETAFKVSVLNFEPSVENGCEYWCDFTIVGELKA
jgi:hypothetical protein